MANTDALLEKIRSLPPEKITEVEDFVEFLSLRTDDRPLVAAFAHLSEPVFGEIWDNPEDVAYDSADAIAEDLARHAPEKVTEAMNATLDQIQKPADPFVTAVASRVLERSEW